MFFTNDNLFPTNYFSKGSALASTMKKRIIKKSEL